MRKYSRRFNFGLNYWRGNENSWCRLFDFRDLRFNKIKEIQPDAFHNLKKLNTLWVRHFPASITIFKCFQFLRALSARFGDDGKTTRPLCTHTAHVSVYFGLFPQLRFQINLSQPVWNMDFRVYCTHPPLSLVGVATQNFSAAGMFLLYF